MENLTFLENPSFVLDNRFGWFLIHFLGDLNGLYAMVGEVGNVYLEAETVFFIAGPEFGNL